MFHSLAKGQYPCTLDDEARICRRCGLYSQPCFVKLAVLALIRIITPFRRDQMITYGLAPMVALWAFSGEFAVAFVCQMPRPWDYLKANCPDHFCNISLATKILS